jgi:hypothetical protein
MEARGKKERERREERRGEERIEIICLVENSYLPL